MDSRYISRSIERCYRCIAIDTAWSSQRRINDPTGLFDVRQFEEITILAGSGLGGSSLINANVAFRPDAEVFQQSVWPRLLQDRAYLDPYFELAIAELGARVEPLDYSSKMLAQRVAAERLAYRGARFRTANITVTRGHFKTVCHHQSSASEAASLH